MVSTHGMACAVATLGLAASAQGTFVHFDLNSISVFAGESFDGVTHTGSLELASDANSSLNAIEIESESQAMSGGLDMLEGRIDLVGGEVVGGFIRFADTAGAAYLASIGDGAGRLNTQAGVGYRVDGLTHDGAFLDLGAGASFAGVSLVDGGAPAQLIRLDGSFLLHGFGPDAFGADNDVNIDLYAQVPAPGPATLALGAAGLTFSRRRR